MGVFNIFCGACFTAELLVLIYIVSTWKEGKVYTIILKIMKG